MTTCKLNKRNLLMCFAAISAALMFFSVTITAQTPANTTTDETEKRAEIKLLNAEAMGLFLQATGDSMREARKKLIIVQNFYLGTGEKRLAASTLIMTGRISNQLGEYPLALKYLEQAVSLWREIGDQKWEAMTLVPLGFVYGNLGEDEKELEINRRILQLSRATDNKIGEAQALRAIGNTYNYRRDFSTALGFYEQALALYREVGAGQSEMATMLAIGDVNFSLGDQVKSLEIFQKVLLLAHSLNDTLVERIALNNIGRVYYKNGRKTEALENFQQILFLNRVSGSTHGEAVSLSVLAKFWKAENNPQLAIFYGKQAVNKYQQLRQGIQTLTKETQKTFLRSVQNIYQQLADLLVSEGRFAEAQQVLGLLKEEEYFEYVRRDPDEIKNLNARAKLKPDEQKLVERYNLLADRITEIGEKFRKLDDKKRKLPEDEELSVEEQKNYEELTAQLNDANATFRLFIEKELVAELGAQGKQRKREIDTDRALQQRLRNWGAGTVILYTIAAEDRYRVILTTPNVQVDGKTEIKVADLNKKIFAFRAALQNPAIDSRPLGKELYDILIKPIEKDLRAANAKTLVWSLDGTLRYIPLAALSPDGKSYLIEKYQSVVITSATRQSLLGENETDWRTLGLGVSTAQIVDDPILPDEKITFSKLPGVKEELEFIVQDELTPDEIGLFAGKRLIDNDFNTKNFGDLLTKETADGKRKYTIVHIASHFRLGDDSANSFLLLGGGNILTLGQISDSPQMTFENVELVTLSACNTALGSDATGKEVDSLATFIELRGAKAIMATLWSVADESTSLLMSEFYRLHKENPQMSKAEAMQKAQIEMIKGKLKSSGKQTSCRSGVFISDNSQQTKFKCDANAPFAHPFYWSPFILIGNWR